MPNVRIAQIGQTGLNKPFFEVVTEGKRYVFTTAPGGLLQLRTPAFLRSIGVYSSVADQFETEPNAALTKAVGLRSDNCCLRTPFFSAAILAGSLAFVDGWSNATGWRNVTPAIFRTFDY